MKWLLHPAASALGVATLCLLAIMGPLLSPSHTTLYHTSGPVLMLYWAVLLDLFAVWALITIMLLFARRPGRRQAMLWSAIVMALPWILLKNIWMLAEVRLPHWVSVSLFILLFAIFVTLAVRWKPAFIPGFQRVLRPLRVIFGFVALNGLVIICQLLWFAWQARALNSPVALYHPQSNSMHRAADGRVIWIILDELSYRQVYEQRFPGMNLPTFDAIAHQSTVFTHVVPAGEYTEEVVPSLITGLPVDRIRASSSGQLFLHNPIAGAWQPFDQHQTVFEDALHAGYSTAAAGWYNPYCRILPQVLDRCFWTFTLPYPGEILASQSPAKNIKRQLLRRIEAVAVWPPALRLVPQPDTLEPNRHIEDFREIRAAGDSILSDRDANFVFLHLPVPHPNGIYNRRSKILTASSKSYQDSYIDNLALADRYLAHIRELLQKQGEWDSSTIVIMGDHSWRTSFIWSKSRDWTPEDEAASHGAQFDDRPAYIVKLPQQQQASRIDAPFKAIRTRALLDALIADQLHTADDLDRWTKEQK